MTDVLVVFRVQHPDLPLTRTVEQDPTAVLRSIHDAGTDPSADEYPYSVRSADFETFEAAVEADPTIDRYDQLVRLEDEAIYSFRYSKGALLFSTEVSRTHGVVMDLENEGTVWVVKTWFPSREAAKQLWDAARETGFDIDLDRISDYGSIVSSRYGLTDAQREAILVALEAGYFDEPRGARLVEVADELGISQPAASGLLRRGIKRLVRSTVADVDR